MNTIIHSTTTQVSLSSPFYEPSDHSYLFSKPPYGVPLEGNMDIPLVIDTEYQGFQKPFPNSSQESRQWLTTQMTSISNNSPVLVLGTDQVPNKYPKPATEFHPVDYLAHLGYNVKLTKKDPKELKGLPKARFVLYAHFAVAELLMVATGDFQQSLIKHIKAGNIELKRRLTTTSGKGKRKKDYIGMSYSLTIDSIEYAVCITYIDSIALHGNASYAEMCSNVGVNLAAKDNFTSAEKAQMSKMLETRPKDFHEYAIGDLEVYKALTQNADKFFEVYSKLGLLEYYQPPRLTMGSTVRDLIEAGIANKIGLESNQDKTFRDFKSTILRRGSAQYYREKIHSTVALASKVEGGRCRNNRPLDVVVENPIVDIDISGCYGEGQRVQEYPIGFPLVYALPINSAKSEYWSLRKFLKVYGGELVPGLWFARVSTQKPLDLPQDFFASWVLNSGHGEDLMADFIHKDSDPTQETEEAEEELFDEEKGNLKLFNKEILNGTLTHDGLQWINHIASRQQRKELLDGLLVKVAVIYPKSQRVNTPEQLWHAKENHSGTNTVHYENGQTTTNENECHAWMSVNLGELLIDDLLFNRKQFPKKTPMNTLFKLCVNTSYGDMTSKYFESANTCVGNNITARARALAWYMEKGFNGFQTITDGCAFELNRVVYPATNRPLNASYLVNLYANLTAGKVRIRPLGGYNKIELNWLPNPDYKPDSKKPEWVAELVLTKGKEVTKKVGYDALSWIDKSAMEHLQDIFPNVDVLHADSTSLKPTKNAKGEWEKIYKARKGQFEFESKDIYSKGVFHGTSNYLLSNPNSQNLKMRSYENKKVHISITQDGDGFAISELYGDKNNPANVLMAYLEQPNNMPRQEPFVKEGMLKVGDYKNRFQTFDDLGILPGDSIRKSGLLRELSLSQFTFQTFTQWRAWDKSYSNRKDANRYAQSFEMFFLNADGTLKYGDMIEFINTAILNQPIKEHDSDPIKLFKSYHNIKRNLEKQGLTVNHPHKEALLRLKEFLNK